MYSIASNLINFMISMNYKHWKTWKLRAFIDELKIYYPIESKMLFCQYITLDKDVQTDRLIEILEFCGINEKFPSLKTLCLREMIKILWKEYKNNWCKIVEYFASLAYDLKKSFIYYLAIESICGNPECGKRRIFEHLQKHDEEIAIYFGKHFVKKYKKK